MRQVDCSLDEMLRKEFDAARRANYTRMTRLEAVVRTRGPATPKGDTRAGFRTSLPSNVPL